MGTVVFHFRVYIDLFQFTNRDLAAIVVNLNENVIVNRLFRLSNGLNTKQIQLVDEGGIVAVNASGVIPEIRLLNSQYVIYEDSVIYNGLPSDIAMTTQYGFDLTIIIVGVENGEVQQGPIGRGNVTLLTPPGKNCKYFVLVATSRVTVSTQPYNMMYCLYLIYFNPHDDQYSNLCTDACVDNYCVFGKIHLNLYRHSRLA